MKKNEYDYYRVTEADGIISLSSLRDTVEEAREIIRNSNERAVRQGYEAKRWLIVHVHSLSVYEDDGKFVSRDISERVVEEYPQTV